MRTRAALVPLLAGAALILLPGSGSAQIRASERARISQTVDGTTFTVDYARPRARGRSPLFGKVVHWDEVWTPGANEATTLETSKDITVNGHALAAGKYSVWMVVRQEGPWEVVFDTAAGRFHTHRPKPEASLLRFPATPGVGPELEVLTWSVPAVSSRGATLEMGWGTTRVALEIGVPASMRRTVAADSAAPYLGAFEITWESDPGEEKKGPAAFDIRYEADGTLRVSSRSPWEDDEPIELMLLPHSPGVFVVAIVQDGDIWQTWSDALLEFAFENGGAVVFELRDSEDDELWASGKRRGSN